MRKDYQADGTVHVTSTINAAFKECTRQLNIVKNNTPAHLRNEYTSRINFYKTTNCYIWLWVRK